jgi:RNA recognition motif-containing protein
MGTRLHVGNLSFSATAPDLRQLFSPFGDVQSADVVRDKGTGESMGFAFVRMGTDGEARAAAAALHGRQHGGRALTVAPARPPESDGRSSSFDRTGLGMGMVGGYAHAPRV